MLDLILQILVNYPWCDYMSVISPTAHIKKFVITALVFSSHLKMHGYGRN